MSRHQLDCRRLLCPLPVIRTQNRVHELLGIEHGDDELVVTVRVGPGES